MQHGVCVCAFVCVCVRVWVGECGWGWGCGNLTECETVGIYSAIVQHRPVDNSLVYHTES